MKKYVLFALFCSLLNPIFSQEDDLYDKLNNPLEISEYEGGLIQRDFYFLENIKGVEYNVLIITDLLTKEKHGYLTISIDDDIPNSTKFYSGYLSFDEINTCLLSLDYINNYVQLTTPTNYIDIKYKNKNNVQVGAYYDDLPKKWIGFTKTNKKQKYFAISNLKKLVPVMIKAKVLINEKTK